MGSKLRYELQFVRYLHSEAKGNKKWNKKTAQQWRDYAGFSEGHFRALIGILDKKYPDYHMQAAAFA